MKKTLLAALIMAETMGGQSWAQPTVYEAVQQLSKNQLDIYDACMRGVVREFDRNARDCLRIASPMSSDQLKEADQKAYLRSLTDDQLKALAASKGFDAFPAAKQDDLKADLKYWLSHLNTEMLYAAGAAGIIVLLMVLARNYFCAIKTRDGRPLFDRSGLLIKAVWNLLIGLMCVLFVIACFTANPLIGLLVVPVPFISRRKAAA